MTGPMTATVTMPSTTRVVVDPWAANPLVDGFTAMNPALVAAALLDGSAPTVFESGDLPVFTASGVDVAILALLPFGVRHYAATAESRGEVLQLVEEYGRDPNASMESDGLTSYIRRVADWLTGRLVQRTAASVNPDPALDESLYAGMFGAQEAALAARNAPALAHQADVMAQQRRTGAYADGIGRARR
jgi:hypothetical protein